MRSPGDPAGPVAPRGMPGAPMAVGVPWPASASAAAAMSQSPMSPEPRPATDPDGPLSDNAAVGAASDSSVGGSAAPPPGDHNRAYSLLRVALLVMRIGPGLMLLVLVVVLRFLSVKFFTSGNIGNVFDQTATIALLAIGMLLVILTRGIDLSVGSTIALAAVVGAMAYHHIHSGPVIILIMLGVGLATGAVNGLVYVYGRIPHPFIVTLATMGVIRGLALWLTSGIPKQGMPHLVSVIGEGRIGWLPKSTFLVAGVALLAAFVCTRVVWGRWIYAVGGNPEGARRTGIPVGPVLVSVYAISGLCAGIAGVVLAGQLNAGTPTAGNGAELDAIAAVVIGGASFLGGRGNVGNALVGALMIGVIRNGMNLLNVNAYLQPIVIGVVIVVAVELDVIRRQIENRFRTLEAARA
jgi:ribose transport system permease protein